MFGLPVLIVYRTSLKGSGPLFPPALIQHNDPIVQLVSRDHDFNFAMHVTSWRMLLENAIVNEQIRLVASRIRLWRRGISAYLLN